jgi:glycosyltransferase involved in cell wall biosynthesis
MRALRTTSLDTSTEDTSAGFSSTEVGEVAFLLKGYPRLSETFIAQEIRGLELAGLRIRIVSLRHPTDRKTHPITAEICSPVAYLPEYLYREPRRVLKAWRRTRRLAGYRAALGAWLADLRRDPSPNRVRRFGQAVVLAAELPASVTRLHAHFLHTPASVARYAGLMTGRPWSVSAHAKDIWTIPDWEKREKLAACAWLVTCTAAGAAHLLQLSSNREKVTLIRHGLDLARFPVPTDPRPPRDGQSEPAVILSIGRAVEKKGFDELLTALATLPAELAWRFVHIGGGPLLAQLKSQAQQLGLASRIEWRGAQDQPQVLAALREADLFALASRVARNGDRDGLPNVLMEAQSQGLAVVATRAGAIEELVLEGRTGFLVPPGEPAQLARAIQRLIIDPELRARLGAAGQARITGDFGFDPGLEQLAQKFGLAPRGSAACA